MFRLVYVSSAKSLFSKEALHQLLEQSRRRNADDHITGLLLYKDGNFLQLLEGEEAQVRQLYQRIEADPRHGGSIVMIDGEVPERLFQDWSMGFRNLSDPEVRSTPGFSDYMNQRSGQSEWPDDASGAIDLIQIFRQGR